MSGTSGGPVVSVVIPTHNRVRLLRDCLVAVERLDFPREAFEVIVVDDGSTDGTPAFLQSFQATTRVRFQNMRQENRGPAAARNAAIRQAAGTYIAFTDDDCSVAPNWLGELVSAMRVPTQGGVGGVLAARSRGLISDYMTMKAIVMSNVDGQRVPAFIITANACFRRDVLIQVGGFDERIRHPGGEDPDLSWRVTGAGYTLGLAPDAVASHFHKTSLSGLISTFYRYGQGNRYIFVKHGLPDSSQSLRRVLCRTLSPRYYVYRVRGYRKQRLGRRQALTFAFLDHVRDLALDVGHRTFVTP